jgi:hypothetical protein
VRLRSERTYPLDVPPDEVWSAVSRVEDYPRWWPWLRDFEGDSIAVGAVWDCVIQPPLPYVLRFRLTFDHVRPAREIRARVSGDADGRGELHFAGRGRGTQLRVVSNLRPATPMLRAVAAIAWPIARFGHDWILDTGVSQFADRGFPGQAPLGS